MYTIEELKDILKERLSKKRYIHSLNVADESKKLAEKWGVDVQCAYLAGLLHDVCKNATPDEQKQMVLRSKLSVTPVEINSPPLWHAIAGAWYAENILEITDKDIINAIRYHTTARAGMTRLEEVVYMADLISADRIYDEVEKMRKLAYLDLDKAMLNAVSFSIVDVVKKSAKLPTHTIEAYNQYSVIIK